MQSPRFAILALLVAIVGLAGGLGFQQWLEARQLEPRAEHAAGSEQRPAFALPDLAGSMRGIDEWDGRVLLVNFWATWCPPCVREMPAFIQLQERLGSDGLTVIAIAIDAPESVRDFVAPLDINFPILLGEEQGIGIAQRYGNRVGVLPYSAVVDREGRIVATHAGELTREEAEALIAPLL